MSFYITNSSKLLHQCLVCGKEHLARPKDKLEGHGHCGRDNNGSGIPVDKPGIIYLVYFYELDIYKYGITGRTVNIRLRGIGHKYETILEIHFATGKEAMELEAKWSSNVQNLKVNTGLLKDGNTETFYY